MAKPKVAVLRTKPESVLDDYRRLCSLAGARDALDPSATTILKDNISWLLMYPGSNTTPWQLEGTILGLQDAGLTPRRRAPKRPVPRPDRGEAVTDPGDPETP